MKRLIALFLSLSFVVGCALSKQASFSSEPAGASVTIAGQKIGTTPVTTELKCRTFGAEKRAYEISKEGYRTQSGELSYKASGRNITIDIIFFPLGGVAKFFCPKPNYHFELQAQSARLAGKATLTVSELHSDDEVYVGSMRIDQGERLTLTPGWQAIQVRRGGALVSVGEVHLDPDTDYVVGLVTHRT